MSIMEIRPIPVLSCFRNYGNSLSKPVPPIVSASDTVKCGPRSPVLNALIKSGLNKVFARAACRHEVPPSRSLQPLSPTSIRLCLAGCGEPTIGSRVCIQKHEHENSESTQAQLHPSISSVVEDDDAPEHRDQDGIDKQQEERKDNGDDDQDEEEEGDDGHIDDDGDDDVAASVFSDTSTIVFDQTPFATYKTQILQLCQGLWPHLRTHAFQIDRLEGGGYNRITAITIDHSQEQGQNEIMGVVKRLFRSALYFFGLESLFGFESSLEHCILRAPRCPEDAWFENELANLEYVGKFTSIPVPRILSYDETTDNPLDSPYSIQTRIPAVNLCDHFRNLNQPQRISLAQQLAKVYHGMLAQRSPLAGCIDPEAFEASIRSLPPLLDFPLRKIDETVTPTECSEHSSIVNMAASLAKRWQEEDPVMQYFWGAVAQESKLMEEWEIFKDVPFCLYHPDLEPRNILINITSPTEVSIEAVLDWDGAFFGPAYMNAKPPCWLWHLGEELEEDYDKKPDAQDLPTDPGNQEVKMVFEQAMGKQWYNWAYAPHYRVARNMALLLTRCPRSNEGTKWLLSTIDQWDELKDRVEQEQDGESYEGESEGESEGNGVDNDKCS